MSMEYWRWKEYNWSDKTKDRTKARVITAGVDVGSVSSQAVILLDGELFAFSSMRTGSSSPDSAKRVMDWALQETGLAIDKINYIIGTGYGRVNVPFVNKTVTEITCHSRGANFIYGQTGRTILDMGGQDCKVIRCDEKGDVITFQMNDKCAAGAGRGLEIFADLLAVPIEDVGKMSLDIKGEPPQVSSTCVIFAKSEAVNLLREGRSKNEVLAAYCAAMAHRTSLMLKRFGVEKDFAITGGIAKNVGIVQRLENELGIKALTPKYDTQIAGALGAAIIGYETVK